MKNKKETKYVYVCTNCKKELKDCICVSDKVQLKVSCPICNNNIILKIKIDESV